jgi:hypothetical protein
MQGAPNGINHSNAGIFIFQHLQDLRNCCNTATRTNSVNEGMLFFQNTLNPNFPPAM